MKADEHQLAAIHHGTGPALVTAGPGSGKTFVLTHRIQYLIDHLGVSPEQILVLTFSKKAAAEMEERFGILCPKVGKRVTFGTFHSVAYRILGRFDRSGFRMLTDEERIQFMFETLEKIVKSADSGYLLNTPEFAEEILRELSICKAKGLPIEAYSSDIIPKEVFIRIIKHYETFKNTRKGMDYEDLLIRARDLLLNSKEVLNHLQNRYRFLLIDEFQDINQIQYEICYMIADLHRNIFAVGDDDQAIYAFRGSNPAFMQRFLLDYKDCKRFELNMNYRSRREIVEIAGRLIAKNKNRITKQIKCNEPVLPTNCGTVTRKVFPTKRAQYEEIISLISESGPKTDKTPVKTDSICILCRTNEFPASLLRALEDSILKDTSDNVQIMTMHASKGLEFDTVILPDLNEGNVPSPHSSHTAEEIEEERRLLYVAMTRAKKHLYLFSVKNKTERIAPSRFLKDCRLKFSDLRRFILHRHR